MYSVLLVGIELLASSLAFIEMYNSYHNSVGIPTAAKIKTFEENMSIEQNNISIEQRIVGGDEVDKSEHPYLAGLLIALRNTKDQSVCGSTLLTDNRLVTAAHCWFDGFKQATRFMVILGSQYLYSGGLRVPTYQVFTHPKWSSKYFDNDIAMIYLPISVSFSDTIQPISLPTVNQLSESFVGEWAVAAGYGKTSDWENFVSLSSSVRQVYLKVITVKQCQAALGPRLIKANNICTSGEKGKGPCNGDSGGPLVLNRNGRNILIGVTSFGPIGGCQRGYPAAFTRVTSFYPFITNHLR